MFSRLRSGCGTTTPCAQTRAKKQKVEGSERVLQLVWASDLYGRGSRLRRSLRETEAVLKGE
eukprot:6097703-Amphidinium_carterae.1